MKVFISHAQTDDALARKVATVLEAAGLDVSNDKADILPGDNWADKVAQALRESEAMVVLLTPEALRSHWVRHDIEYALGQKGYHKRLIPVLATTPEKIAQEDIPWILRRLNMLELPDSDQDSSLKQIAQAVLDAA